MIPRTSTGALVEAVESLADAAIDRVLLTGERVTSAAEGRRLLAGEAETGRSRTTSSASSFWPSRSSARSRGGRGSRAFPG